MNKYAKLALILLCLSGSILKGSQVKLVKASSAGAPANAAAAATKDHKTDLKEKAEKAANLSASTGASQPCVLSALATMSADEIERNFKAALANPQAERLPVLNPAEERGKVIEAHRERLKAELIRAQVHPNGAQARTYNNTIITRENLAALAPAASAQVQGKVSQ